MFRLERSVMVLSLCACFSGYLYGQAWSGVLSPSRAIDWSNAGVVGGIPASRTQCVTSQCTVVSSGTTVTSSSINAAISSAPANTYVLIPAGTFSMGGGIIFNNKSYVTLRGAGSNSTFLIFGSGGSCGGGSGHDICAQSSDVNYWGGPSNTATWSGTNGVNSAYTKGARSIRLSSVANLSAGDPIILDQNDDASDNGGLYVGCETSDGSAACYSGAGPSGFQRSGRGQQQIVNVVSISGSGPYDVTITPGIYAANWRTSQTPGAWWATNPVFGDAVENLSANWGSGDGILWFNCTGCWVKGIRGVRTTTTGTGYWHVTHMMSNHCTVRDSYFFGFDGDSYMVSASIASDLLIENNIIQRPGNIAYNSDCEGCVAAFNFFVDPTANTSNWLSQSHFYHSVMLFGLDEGNIGTGVYADSFHGTHDLNTHFRNRWDGNEPNNGVATTSGTIPIRLNPGTRYQNIIGNVLGTAGYHTSYSGGYTSIYDFGNYYEVGTSDGLTGPTSMFWGNWDTATNGVTWNASEVPSAGLPNSNAYANAVPATQTLPSSFYLSSKPLWVSASKPWPLIGPEITSGNVGQCVAGTMQHSACTANSQCPGSSCSVIGSGRVVSNPAMDCYLTTMGGAANGNTTNAYAFDASACYPSSSTSGGGGGSVNPPSGLSAIVQ